MVFGLTHAQTATCLSTDRRLGELAASEAALRDALAASEADAAPAIRAALSLVLRDAGQAAHADHERHAAFGVDAAQAQAALDMLEQLR